MAYEVSWMGVPVGIGTLEIKETVELNDRKAFHVLAVAETNDFLSKIYPVHDEVHSWIDAETFQSLQFQKKVHDGLYGLAGLEILAPCPGKRATMSR